MNTNKTIENTKQVGYDYFRLYHLKKSKKYLKDHLRNFNPNDYYIFKSTSKQRLISYEEFLEFKWSGYMFFKKDLYDINHINNWIDYWKLRGIKSRWFYLAKPFPPFNPDKIIIKL